MEQKVYAPSYAMDNSLADYPTKGDNQRGVLIVNKESTDAALSQSSETLLNKILKAVDLSWDDVLVINVNGQPPLPFYKLKRTQQFERVLSLGVDFSTMGLKIKIPKHNILDFYDVQLLKSIPLEQLARDKKQKRQLWQSLQQMFKLKST
jgi:DNA polymerase III psi subunit